MARATSSLRQNHLLASLAATDLASLAPHLEAVELSKSRAVEAPNRPIKHVYFPTSGIISVVACAPNDRKIEVGIIGLEGMSGISIVLGDDRSANETFVQVAGNGFRVGARTLGDAMEESLSMRLCFSQYAQAFLVQAAHTALANGRANVEERLARWLLMAHDRLDGDELPFTHQLIALMLGVRRAGVTNTLNLLASRKLIVLDRGRIMMRDRAGVEALANGLYGVPEAEYRRLIGWRGKA